MQDEIRPLLCRHCGEMLTEVKELRIRYRHEMQLLRGSRKCSKRSFAKSLLSDADSIAMRSRLCQLCQACGIEPYVQLLAYTLPLRCDLMEACALPAVYGSIRLLRHLPCNRNGMICEAEQIGTIEEPPFSCHRFYPSM